MLTGDYNKNEQAEAVKQKVLNLRVSYTDELAGKLDTALQFVVRKIGFRPAQEFSYNSQFGKDLILNDPEGNKLNINLQKLGSSNNITSIIFHTDDCLRDYHKYILLGVEFTSRPEYNGSGLQVNFIDDTGNCYTLLEERIYTES